MLGRLDNRKRGFTLVEVLVATSIGIMMGVVILSLYIVSDQSFKTATTFLEIQGGARLAMDRMIKDIKGATRLIFSRTIEGEAYTTGNSELIIEIPSIDTAGDIIDIDTTYDYIVFHLKDADSTNTKLERVVDADVASSRADGTHSVANNVNSLVFSSGGTELSSIGDVTTLTNIAIELTTSKVASGRTIGETINSIVELRNKE